MTSTDSASSIPASSFTTTTTSVRGTGQSATFHFKKGSIYDENGYKVCSTKMSRGGRGKVTLGLSIGRAILDKDYPDKIELQDKNKQVLGHLQMVEKDLFTFECSIGSFKLDRMGNFGLYGRYAIPDSNTEPFKVVDPDGQEVLSLEYDPAQESKTFGITIPGYTLNSSGILNHDLTLILAMTIFSGNYFLYYVKPSTSHAFTVKKSIRAHTFRDSQGYIYGKITGGVHPLLWVIGFLLFPVFGIGLIILVLLFTMNRRSGKTLVSANGEKLGTIKGSRWKRTLEIPARRWTGSLGVDMKSVAKFINVPTGNTIFTTSTGNYNIKMYSILEDDDDNRLFTIYGYTNDFVITMDDKFDPVITCLTAYCMIDMFLTPRDSGGD
jgi:hypothetical protein